MMVPALALIATVHTLQSVKHLALVGTQSRVEGSNCLGVPLVHSRTLRLTAGHFVKPLRRCLDPGLA